MTASKILDHAVDVGLPAQRVAAVSISIYRGSAQGRLKIAAGKSAMARGSLTLHLPRISPAFLKATSFSD